MGDNNSIRIKKEGHIAWLVLNRPEKRNAMTMTMFTKLSEFIRQIDNDTEIRVVIIKGEGKSFTVGLDIAEEGPGLINASTADEREGLRRIILDLQECMNVLEKCRKPVIAAVHGHCIGGGIDLTSACDIRIAAKDAIFSIAETRMAIIADVGTLQRLPTIIGQGWFRELALTGREFTSTEALQMGFITRVCEDKEDLYTEAKKLAEKIAANAPLTVEGTKDTILFTRDNGIYASLSYVAQKNAAMLPSEDLKEAFAAFLEKRSPEFKGK